MNTKNHDQETNKAIIIKKSIKGNGNKCYEPQPRDQQGDHN
jgi:hypothetical protein